MATHSSILAWKNPTDGGAWRAKAHGVTKSRTRLSYFLAMTLEQTLVNCPGREGPQYVVGHTAAPAVSFTTRTMCNRRGQWGGRDSVLQVVE